MTKIIKKRLIALFALILSVTVLLCVYIPAEKASAESNSIITLTQAASCRVVPDDGDGLSNSGLKFEAKLEKTAFNKLVADYQSVEAGIIIVPEDYVTAAGGYTLDKLSSLDVLNGKSFYTITESYNEYESYYAFYNSIVTIKPSNYNRNFTAASFIKVVETDADKIANLEGFVNFDGAYYLYSNSHTANVYEVAYAAYEDRVTEEKDGYFETEIGSGIYGRLDSKQYKVLEKYLDSVAVLTGENGNVVIANNSGTYYESSYQVVESIDGISYLSNKPTALTYNGERYKNLSVVDDVNGIKVETNMISNGLNVNNDGSVSLENRYPANGISWFNDINKSFDNSYIAFEGNYGVGTYIDFTFKGNNLPQVCLFANNINGNMSRGGETSTSTPVNNGYIIMNGFYGGTTAYDTDKLLLMGPNRMDGTCNYTNVWQKEATLTISGGKFFAQKNLDANTTYKYTVGSYVDTDGKVVIDVTISNAETSEVIKQATRSTGKTKAEVEALGGNIIAYSCVKGGTDATAFTFTSPYEPSEYVLKSSGAVFNNDGSVSLENRYPANGISWFNDINKSFDNSYIAFEGNYGVGTCIDFTFKGNNLPQVCLFANNINGNMSRGGETSTSTPVNNGYIIMNGFYGGTTAYDTDKLLLMGPNRMDGTCNYTNVWQKEAALSISGGKFFAQKNLDANTTYKYTVGSYVDTDGKVVIDVTISNAETSEVIKQATKSTGKTKAEVEALGGNIIAYGCIKGGTDATTFKYSAPYTK